MNVSASLLVFALIVVAAFGVHYTMEIDRSSRELQVLKSQKERIKDVIEKKRSIGDSGEGLLAETSAIRKQKADLAKQLHAARLELEELETTYKTICAKLPTIVKRLRERAVGEEFDVLRTSDGKTFRAVTLKEVTDEDVSILHSAGSSRLSRSSLAPEMVNRFRMGKEFPGLGTAEAGDSEIPMNASGVENVSSAPNSESNSDARRQRIAKLSLQIEHAKRNRMSWQAEAERAETAVLDLKTRGRPTWKEAEAARIARAAVFELDRQIAKAETLLIELGGTVTR